MNATLNTRFCVTMLLLYFRVSIMTIYVAICLRLGEKRNELAAKQEKRNGILYFQEKALILSELEMSP